MGHVSPRDGDHAAEVEPVPQLDVWLSSGSGDDQEWGVRCRTCGWQLAGRGDTTPRNQAAKAHRCPIDSS